MDLFDTHFHLPEEGDLENYLEQLYPEHSYRMMAMAASAAGSIRALEFARRHPNVWCSCGVHPHDAEDFDGNMEQFQALVSAPENRAVGEIGLDFFYDFAPREKQITCFEKFLRLALEKSKPICIHCRDKENSTDAYQICYSMLKDFASQAGEGKAVLHCYAGNQDYLEKFLDIGCYIGVTGMVTFPKSSNIRDNLRLIPRERLLFETDSPYLAPVPFRGKTNHPALTAHVVSYAAGFLGETAEKLASDTTANALRFFAIEA